MRRFLAFLLICTIAATLLSGCSSNTPAKSGEPTTAVTTEATTTTTTEATTTTTVTETTRDFKLAKLSINGKEYEIRMKDVDFNEKSKAVTITVDCSGWLEPSDTTVEIVIDGKSYFMESCKQVNNDPVITTSWTSDSEFSKMPEKVLFYEGEKKDEAVVYDVAKGTFLIV